ncbi:copper resistance protein NlpE [Polaribacter vadi]|uniref:lipocalin family protein n=1 Tax=Polaribacter TaxID=52959 RepID=UPI001C0A103D|nr:MULTISPECIES: lipocalin family protein [Polaribacter]MBU3012316.1 copper resistance protein NlpE [Polaribacter vadi]MDO6742133.1 lipocalin family protein [Polaribacter sp. 1_MG-2023]
MKRHYWILLILVLGFTSCHFMGPIDVNIERKNVEVNSNDIIGTWKMDKFSYEYLSEIKTDSIVLTFKPDNLFEMNNSQNLFDREINNGTSSGTWKIIEQYDTKKIKLNFNDIKTSKNLEIYKLKENYQLWYFLSDPDTGERIRFLK